MRAARRHGGVMPPFLRAEWRHLVMVNYEVQPDLVRALVPRGTELDSWNGRTYVSVVGFLFLGSRLWGVPIPFHSHFEEVNLRFYVKHRTPEGYRRGVVFVRELVPKRAVAGVARWLYGEPYAACPMGHRIEVAPNEVGVAEYRWRLGGAWHCVRAEGLGPPVVPAAGSQEEFIAEHYWGYTSLDGKGCREYEVRHPAWKVRKAKVGTLECDVAAVYGPRFVEALGGEPSSAFVAEGSPVTVHRWKTLRETPVSSIA